MIHEDRTELDRRILESEIRHRIQLDPTYRHPYPPKYPAFHTCKDHFYPCKCAVLALPRKKKKKKKKLRRRIV